MPWWIDEYISYHAQICEFKNLPQKIQNKRRLHWFSGLAFLISLRSSGAFFFLYWLMTITFPSSLATCHLAEVKMSLWCCCGREYLFAICENAKCLYCVNKCEYRLLKPKVVSLLWSQKKINFMPLHFYTGHICSYWSPFYGTDCVWSSCCVLLGVMRLELSAVRG